MCCPKPEDLKATQWRPPHLRVPPALSNPLRMRLTSTAGPEASVLLELKGHLEDSLRNGARLLRTQRLLDG